MPELKGGKFTDISGFVGFMHQVHIPRATISLLSPVDSFVNFPPFQIESLPREIKIRIEPTVRLARSSVRVLVSSLVRDPVSDFVTGSSQFPVEDPGATGNSNFP